MKMNPISDVVIRNHPVGIDPTGYYPCEVVSGAQFGDPRYRFPRRLTGRRSVGRSDRAPEGHADQPFRRRAGSVIIGPGEPDVRISE